MTDFGFQALASVPGGLNYLGVWNANTNTPLITSGVGSPGDYYIVDVPGNTNIDGISDWAVGDWIIFSTTGVWQKIDNSDLEGYNLIQEEGVALPKRSIIDFVGGGVTASDDPLNLKTIVTINGASGRFGIADSNGAYTYYTTLTLAMAAAVSGQTIEFFTDYTETGAVTITLKNGVTINGNGHTYFHTEAGSTNTFNTLGTGGTFNIFNLNITRTNSTGGYVLVSGGGVFGVQENFYLNGSLITCNNTAINTSAIFTNKKFYNGNIVLTGSGFGIIPNQIGEISIYNFNVRAISTASSQVCYGVLAYNCTFEHEGTTGGQAISSYSKLYECSVISRGSTSCVGIGTSGYNSSFYCAAGACTNVNTVEFNNCTFISAGSYGIYTETPVYFRNCTIISTSNVGAINGSLVNCSVYSTANTGAEISTGTLENCSVTSAWNNANGHGFRVTAANLVIKNNVLKVTNASANCIYSSSPFTLKYAQNTFQGATVSVNANVTQGMINTDDAYGNITV